MKIEILGTGCRKCDALEANARTAAIKLGVPFELEHVKDLRKISAYGVMITPALAVNGQVLLVGKVASEAEITTLLTSALAKSP